ncbi:unnamed protein product [Symbiodinium microadriaticum]|nr:unnamed protein product [Symbiodinium microadriaticum]
MTAIQTRVDELQLQVNEEAFTALLKLPEDHAFELLDAVAQKSARGEVKDISNYISATISPNPWMLADMCLGAVAVVAVVVVVLVAVVA